MVYTDLNAERAEAAAFVHFIGEFRHHHWRCMSESNYCRADP
jgi:hypothetical protein